MRLFLAKPDGSGAGAWPSDVVSSGRWGSVDLSTFDRTEAICWLQTQRVIDGIMNGDSCNELFGCICRPEGCDERHTDDSLVVCVCVYV